MNDKLLIMKDVRRTYHTGGGDLEILKGVDLTLDSGEWCCIYGASGSGKTTLLNLVGALERPESGSICICGENIAGFSRRQAAKFRAEKIGFVFQSYHLLPELTALENVMLSGEIAGLSGKTSRKKAMELLDKVGLTARMSHRPPELSGGEQQRAAIARALINSPRLLLADEPTGNLDPDTGSEVLQLFQELRRDDPGMTILMITHNREIAALASRNVELKQGVLI